MSSVCAFSLIFFIGSYLLYRFFTKTPVPPDFELEAIIAAPLPQEPLLDDDNADEHAVEFADTLSALKTGDVETSDYEQSEFADIIDEEEVEKAESNQAVLGFIVFILWIIFEIMANGL